MKIQCFSCDKELEAIRENTVQSYGALTFSSAGNYGSRIFDPFLGGFSLVIAICDDCVTEKVESVFVQKVERGPVTVTYEHAASVADFPE